jgi:hypothetical protein
MGTLVAHTKLQAQGGGTSAGIDTTGANLIVIGLVQAFAANVSVSDNKGNTYTAESGSSDPTTFFKTSLFWLRNPVVGTGHTFTLGGGNNNQACCVIAIKTASGGIRTGTGTSSSGGSTGSTTVQPGSITPSPAPSLVVVNNCMRSAHLGDAFISIDQGFQFSDTIDENGAATYLMGFGYLFQSVAAAVNPTATVNATPTSLSASMYSFPMSVDSVGRSQGFIYG